METTKLWMAMAVGAALAGAAAGGTAAQAPSPPVPSAKDPLYVTDAQMAHDGNRVLGTAPTYSYQVIVRDKPGEIEIHDTRNDIILVQEGRADVQLGGTVTGGRVTAPGEHRGGTAVGYKARTLGPGDVLFVPAGLPHLITPAAGSPRFRYVVVKTQP